MHLATNTTEDWQGISVTCHDDFRQYEQSSCVLVPSFRLPSVVFFTFSLRTAVSTTRTRSAWLRGKGSHLRPDGYEPTALLLSYPAKILHPSLSGFS